MAYVADLHLHSPYSRATSRDLTFENMARWARLKGIDLLATGDFTHPLWLAETRRKLRETAPGIYGYDGVSFLLATEVNCVSSVGGRQRRVHVLLLAPDLEAVDRLNAALARHGDLAADGRPTLHLSPGQLMTMALEADERFLVIPAHVWTPWFGVFGSKSGFDSLEECFGELAPLVPAVETGLSSDPAMNWRVPWLDDKAIVSFSDAHSLPNMGRELTVFNGEMTFEGLARALKEQDIAYTAEFFPQEGKYHYSGHRNCGVRYSPAEVATNGARCPVCRRPLTLGVLQRVEELGHRQVRVRRVEDGLITSDQPRPPFRNLVPLREILAEALGVGRGSRRVEKAYLRLVEALGGELRVLTEAAEEEIAALAGPRVAEGVLRARRGQVHIAPGFDGVYGLVRVWPPEGDDSPTDAEPAQRSLLGA